MNLKLKQNMCENFLHTFLGRGVLLLCLICVLKVTPAMAQKLTLNFQKQINKHEIGALLGYSQEWYNFSSLSASRKKIPFDGIYVRGWQCARQSG